MNGVNGINGIHSNGVNGFHHEDEEEPMTNGYCNGMNTNGLVPSFFSSFEAFFEFPLIMLE